MVCKGEGNGYAQVAIDWAQLSYKEVEQVRAPEE